MKSQFEGIEKLEQLSKDEQEYLSTACTDFYRIIKALRGPEGCPWDRKQTPKSLAPNLIEESYELVDAIENNDIPNIREEIGDLFLVAGMISEIYSESNTDSFSLAHVLSEVSEKLVRRHPHVFGDIKKDDPEEVIELWNHIKKNVEKNGDSFESINDSIPRSLPPLERAFKIQKKVAKVGFDWENVLGAKDKLTEELAELDECIHNPESHSKDSLEYEIGDVLFSIINVARHLDIDPALALHKTNQKFTGRFRYIEQEMYKSNKKMSSEEFDLMEKLWKDSKNTES